MMYETNRAEKIIGESLLGVPESEWTQDMIDQTNAERKELHNNKNKLANIYSKYK